MEYYSAIQKDEIFLGKRMEIKAITLREVGQTQKGNVLRFVPLVDSLARSDICISFGIYTKVRKLVRGYEREISREGKRMHWYKRLEENNLLMGWERGKQGKWGTGERNNGKEIFKKQFGNLLL